MTHTNKPEDTSLSQLSPNAETNNIDINSAEETNNLEARSDPLSTPESPSEAGNDSQSGASTEATNPIPAVNLINSDNIDEDLRAPAEESSQAINPDTSLPIEEADPDVNLPTLDQFVETSQVDNQDFETASARENVAEVTEQQNLTEIPAEQSSDDQAYDQSLNEIEPSTSPPSVPDETPNLKQEIAQLKQQLAQSKQRSTQLEERSTQLAQQLHQLENQLALLDQPIDKEASDMELELSKDLYELIDNARYNDTADRDTDNQELSKHQDQIQRVLELGAILHQGMKQVIDQCANELLPDCRRTRESLLPDLQVQIQSRHDALELIGRMVDRLREAVGKLGNNALSAPVLVEVNRYELIALLDEAYRSNQETIDKAMFKKVIDKKLKEVSNQRYQQITETRSLAESQRSQLLNLVKQKILPVLDGLYEGQNLSKPLIDHLAGSYPDQQDTLNQWLGFHSELYNQIQGILTQIGIHPMTVQRGDAADYNRHSPLGVEADSELDNEHVKEVSQQGYEYKETDQSAQMLRPAQVIMVKN